MTCQEMGNFHCGSLSNLTLWTLGNVAVRLNMISYLKYFKCARFSVKLPLVECYRMWLMKSQHLSGVQNMLEKDISLINNSCGFKHDRSKHCKNFCALTGLSIDFDLILLILNMFIQGFTGCTHLLSAVVLRTGKLCAVCKSEFYILKHVNM